MEQRKSPENAGQDKRYRDFSSSEVKGLNKRNLDPYIVPKLKSREVETTAIRKDMLPLCLDAGLASGFEVIVIAKEGEEYPYLAGKSAVGMITFKNGKKYDVIPGQVCIMQVTGKGNVAVSIESSEGAKDHAPFWDKLTSLEQDKAHSPSKLRA